MLFCTLLVKIIVAITVPIISILILLIIMIVLVILGFVRNTGNRQAKTEKATDETDGFEMVTHNYNDILFFLNFLNSYFRNFPQCN